MAIVAKLPGPYRWPFVGNAALFIWKSPPEMINIITEIHRQFPRIIASCLQTGLLTATGKKWFQRRKVITPAFHFKILDQFVEIFDKQSAVFVENLAKSKGQPLDVFQPITLCALDIICETAMGVQIQAQINSDSVYVQAVKRVNAFFCLHKGNPRIKNNFFHICRISGLLSKRIFTFYLRNDFIFNLTPLKRRQDKLLKILHGFTDEVIVSRRAELMNDKKQDSSSNHDQDDIGVKKKMAFLDILLQSTIEGKPLTNMDIREKWILLCLRAMTQLAAYEEVRHVIGDDLDTPVTIKLLNDLNYLEMVIKETLRLYPSVPMYGRKMQENIDMNGFIIPKGSNIGISPIFMARDPTLWENPFEFIPERFESDNQYHPYLNVPFSAGPRNCIGQKFAMLEMKSTITHMLYQLAQTLAFLPFLLNNQCNCYCPILECVVGCVLNVATCTCDPI
ncbi:hypothetical protein PVAND_015086 [Polypedilum vanderplanki]|uniref:Cytochrome P450 n=1 Tax=Polypedilum vanderplanki TaxID=319348 RepID=A0A9J6BBN4_POLVA|nr:hypothetical protein PVAND_015086 [Polypedilum vanderplanki]